MPAPKLEHRRYIRHPVDIPIICQADREQLDSTQVLKDVSAGGVSFISYETAETGSVVRITIDVVKPSFTALARVEWCHPENGQFLVGVSFVEDGADYQARMVEQLCYIETYRKSVLEEEGRALTSQEAALEWIGKFAGDFPDFKNK